MKELSKQISEEIWITPSYAIARFMKHKGAFKTKENQPMICTLKIVKEKELEPEVQLHLRFNGRDLWRKEEDTLDVDLYIPFKEWQKALALKETTTK